MNRTTSDGHRPPAHSEPPARSVQHLLQLWLFHPTLHAGVVAWSRHDPVAGREADDLPTAPPYPTAMHAMRDGWRLISFSPATPALPGAEFRLSYLPNEVVLERMEASHVR